MATASAEKMEGMDDLERPDKNEDPGKSAEVAVSLKGERLKMEALLGQIGQRGAQGKEIAERYRKAIEADATKGNAEGISGLYKWTEKQWEQAEKSLSRITQSLDRAVFARILNAEDRGFLLASLVQTNAHDFLLKHEEAARVVEKKIDNATKDRHAYDAIFHHPSVKDGKLTVKQGKEVGILPPDEFMKKSLPERRKLIGEWQEALKQAAGTTQVAEGAEAKKLEAGYRAKLDQALKSGFIGQKTYDAFLNRKPDGFVHQSLEKKRMYLGEFDAQMERYRTLWKEVKENLRPDSQKHMESVRKKLGYKELMAEYEAREAIDKKTNEKEYAGKLKEVKENPKKGWIGTHTMNAFMTAFREQPLKTQNQWNKKETFEGQMHRYEELWKGIKKDLPKHKQEELKKKQDELGYTQMRELYEHLKHHAEQSTTGVATSVRAERIIQTRITNQGTRQGVEAFGKEMEKEPSRLQRVVTMFRRMVEGGEGHFNPAALQKGIARKREKEGETVNLTSKEQPKDEKKKEGQSNVKRSVREVGYAEKEMKAESSKDVKREAAVDINRQEGLRHFFARDQEKTHIGDEIRQGRDHISWTIRMADSTSKKLTWEEVRATKEYLEEVEREKEAA
ncbi:hypothetical protein HZA43_05660 [Candidatus Peregrinibacteria bacterium]|nr:hypothetical protein [Candidatus Peregrinibacteria bacterium]